MSLGGFTSLLTVGGRFCLKMDAHRTIWTFSKTAIPCDFSEHVCMCPFQPKNSDPRNRYQCTEAYRVDGHEATKYSHDPVMAAMAPKGLAGPSSSSTRFLVQNRSDRWLHPQLGAIDS